MSPLTRIVLASAASLLALSLTACDPAQDASDADPSAAAPATQAADGDLAAGAECPEVPQEGYELFSDARIVNAPEAGAVYGDGTPISWTFDGPVEGTPDVDMSYVNEAGDAIPMGGIFLEDFGGNEWGSTLNVFTSDADGRPGFMIVGLTHDAGIENGELAGTHEVLGIYCVTFEVAE